MQLSHNSQPVTAPFDLPNLVSSTGQCPDEDAGSPTGLGVLAHKWSDLP